MNAEDVVDWAIAAGFVALVLATATLLVAIGLHAIGVVDLSGIDACARCCQ